MSALFALAAHGGGHLASLALHLAPKPGPAGTGKPAPTASSPTAATRKVAMSVPRARSEGAVTRTQGWWGRGYNSDSRRRDRERSRDWWRSEDDDDEDEDEDERESEPRPVENRGTYRTLCVRLCDGFYWPISFATTPEHFDSDQRKCRSSCGAPVRLYTYRNPGGEPESMEDLNGQPYSRLKTAFLYRTAYDSSCKCKSQPWEQEAADRHRMYALQAAKRKGDKAASQELALLEARMEGARKAALAQRRAAAGSRIAVTSGEAADQPSAETGGDDVAPAPASARNGRMSLGARSAPASRPSAAPARLWRHSADNAP